MDDLKIDDLVIRVDRSVPARLRLDWLGCSNPVEPGERLIPFFDEVLGEAKEGGRFVEMHFETLDHFNSSTIATLIRLIRSARKSNVMLRIHYAADLRWQAISFETLERAVSSFENGEGPNVEFFSGRTSGK